MNRRKVLAALGSSAAVALAGCSNGGNGDDNNSTGNGGGNGNGNGNGNSTGNGNGNGNSTNGNTTSGEDLPDFEEISLSGSQFAGKSTGGIVWFGEPDRQAAMESALSLPPQEDAPAPVKLKATVNGDGTWESEAIDFPPLSGIDTIPTTPRVETPGGFQGELDAQAGRWTVNGRLRVIIPQEDENLTLEFPLNATTGESGALTGSFERNGETATATVVDNETAVDTTTGSNIIDSLLGLNGPAGEEGANWFRLKMDLRFGGNL
jgi:hypothetical protein